MINILFPWPLLYRTGTESRTKARHINPVSDRTRPRPTAQPWSRPRHSPSAVPACRHSPTPRPPVPLPGSPFPPLPKVTSHPTLPTLRFYSHQDPTNGAGKTDGPGEAGETSATRRPPRSPSSGRPQYQAHGRHGPNWHGGGAG